MNCMLCGYCVCFCISWCDGSFVSSCVFHHHFLCVRLWSGAWMCVRCLLLWLHSSSVCFRIWKFGTSFWRIPLSLGIIKDLYFRACEDEKNNWNLCVVETKVHEDGCFRCSFSRFFFFVYPVCGPTADVWYFYDENSFLHFRIIHPLLFSWKKKVTQNSTKQIHLE